jgi:sterol desaturase/sphingolipid hydroxylase (fatty acid hydroxylase superfamily)
MANSRRFGWSGVLGVAGFGLLLWLEHRDALRATVEKKERRVARNLAVAGVSAVALQLIERPVSLPVAKWVERRRFGILQRLALPAWLETSLAVVMMDYSLYLWHVLEHRFQPLWRFHAVHHADLDLDASTALRFHFGELAASVPWRVAQILIIGVTPRSLAVYQRLLMLSIMFHHSNVKLPIRLERWLSLVITTPRLHGIHHSIVDAELNSNWSSGLSLWDMLHGTFRTDVAQTDITIGLANHQNAKDLTLPRILEMPFVDAHLHPGTIRD